MKYFYFLIVSFGLTIGFFSTSTHAQQVKELCFTPGDDCTALIINALDAAKETILVQAYSFTSAPIAKALKDAHNRGVVVSIILDRSQEKAKYSSADFLHNSSISVLIDRAHAIAHNKVMIIDADIVVTGSFNFTAAAQKRNSENVVILHDKAIADRYRENWKRHADHSEVYQGKS